MKLKRPPIPVLVIIGLLILIGGYYGIRAIVSRSSTSLTASGTIEAVTVVISPEIGGKVLSVDVEEGAAVKEGDVLFRMDDTLMVAQQTVSEANLQLTQAALASAQAQYDLSLDSAMAESATSRTAFWRAIQPSGYTLPGWYFSRADEISSAQSEVNAAKTARDAAQSHLDDLLGEAKAAEFKTAEQRILNARTAFLVAQNVLTRSRAAGSNADLLSSAQSAFDAAQTELNDAQSAFDDFKDSDTAGAILNTRADLAAAQERFDSAQDHLLVLQTGVYSPRVAAAEAALNQAEAAVSQAQAGLDLINVQLEKLIVKAPLDGVILTRSIEPGEVVAAGADALNLGQLDSLTITVFIPEETYGDVSLGQTTSVSVDSYPGETFSASVVHIADQAEFTPRNVQTVEGRKSTVFAIKLQVQDPNGRLKPGMPADVTFK